MGLVYEQLDSRFEEALFHHGKALEVFDELSVVRDANWYPASAKGVEGGASRC